MQCMHGPKCKLGSYCTVGRRLQEVNLLGGLILPVWGTVEKALSKQVSKLFLAYFVVDPHEIAECWVLAIDEMIEIIDDQAQVNT